MKRRGFSLVEVAIAASVMGSAALLLGAAISTANAQKASGRRSSLARSLAVRQLELIQERVNETEGAPPQAISLASGSGNEILTLASLRGGGHTVSLSQLTAGDGTNGQKYGQNGGPIGGSSGQVISKSTCAFHVLKPSTSPTVQLPAGSMLQADLDRVTSEQLDVNLWAAACTMDGYTDEGTPAQLPAALQSIELIMFQVDVVDAANGNTVLCSLSRLIRVRSSAAFGTVAQF